MISVRERIRKIIHLEVMMTKLALLVKTNCRLIGEVVIITELLKKKGLLTQDEITEEIIRIRKEQEEQISNANEDSQDPTGGDVQSEASGDNEDRSRDSKC